MTRPRLASAIAAVLTAASWLGCAAGSAAQSLAPLCTPAVGPAKTVVSAMQRLRGGENAQPPLIDIFAWPDGPFGVLRSAQGYAFFATDGGQHRNGKAGSVTTTLGDLDNPLGSGSGDDAPRDVSIERDLKLNPNFPNYSYVGGGPVLLVPPGFAGAGNLLTVYHAERNTANNGFYSLLGLARSVDGGNTWRDLGEIVEANQPFRYDLGSYDIGISQPVIEPSGTYLYVYFPDWIANGTNQPTSETVMSVARVPLAALTAAAFAPNPHALPGFRKYYQGRWDQPGINGHSTDLEAGSIGGSPSVTYDAHLARYVVIADDTTNISYGESPDGLTWTARQVIFSQSSALYARAVGRDGDPNVLGASFYVFYTRRINWNNADVRRFDVSCPAG